PPTRVLDDLVRRTHGALEQTTREAMRRDYVEPPQTDREREREDRQLFKQAETLLLACGLRDLAQKARHAGDEWVLAEPIGVLDEGEAVQGSKLALEKLRAVLDDNQALVRERLLAARLPGANEEAEGGRAAFSTHSGPLPSEARRDPDTRLPAMPAEN